MAIFSSRASWYWIFVVVEVSFTDSKFLFIMDLFKSSNLPVLIMASYVQPEMHVINFTIWLHAILRVSYELLNFISPFVFLILVVCVFWFLALIYQHFWHLKNVCIINILYCLFGIHFTYLFSDLYYLFSSTNFGLNFIVLFHI